ncbi:MAG: hypothetical protein GYA56_00025 [Geobacteraceae bacterium]|nr:hypothetical protein [Geobacteraceae bacterium]
MKNKITLVLCCVLFVSNSYAYTIRNVDGTLVHETNSIAISERFIEDVCFLLPVKLTEIILKDKTIKRPTRFNRKAQAVHIQPNYDFIIKQSNLSGEEYWKKVGSKWDHGALSKEAFTDDVLTISKRLRQPDYRNNTSYIIDVFARTVRNIIEIGLRSTNKNDVANYYLVEATKSYQEFSPDDYIISYRYNNIDIRSKIDVLYAINSINDRRCIATGEDIINNYIYTELVKITADIWTQIWEDNPPHENIVFRKVTLRNLQGAKPTFNTSNRLEDYDEWMMYLRRDRISPDNWKANVIEKRIDDYIYENIRYNINQIETLKAKQWLNVKNLDDYPKVDFTKLMDAVRYQKSFAYSE